MATEDIVQSPTIIGTVFPSQVGVDYVQEVGSTDKFPDVQVYTIAEIYGMVRVDLTNLGVSPERISFPQFLFFLRDIMNDYSGKVEEFQLAFSFTNGGSLFKVPNMNRIIALDVNGCGATAISEQGMTLHRAAETTLRTNEFIYSLNGNLLSLYPAISSSDTISVLASVFMEDFDEDSADVIVLKVDGFALYDGVRWKCREHHGKDYLEARGGYFRRVAERKSRVERQLYPGQLKPDSFLRL